MSDAAAEPQATGEPGAATEPGATGELRGANAEPRSESDALLSRLRLIEDQPLESRAAAFTELHEQLQHRLEGGDSSGSHG